MADPADRAGDAAAAGAAEGDRPSNIDFVTFVQSLYLSALMALGEVENPETKQFSTNLDLAQQNGAAPELLRSCMQSSAFSEIANDPRIAEILERPAADPRAASVRLVLDPSLTDSSG